MLMRPYSLLCSKRDLFLDRFAFKTGRSEISEALTEYMASRDAFCALINKYEVFSTKEASVEQTARMVGLQVPGAHIKSRNS
jgi:hypothetical protein